MYYTQLSTTSWLPIQKQDWWFMLLKQFYFSRRVLFKVLTFSYVVALTDFVGNNNRPKAWQWSQPSNSNSSHEVTHCWLSPNSLSQNVTTSIRPPMISHHPSPPPSNPIVLGLEISPDCVLPAGGVIRHTPFTQGGMGLFDLLLDWGRWRKCLEGAAECGVSNDPGVLQRGKSDLRRCTFMQSWDLRE